ncbi:MAG TPA: nitroreductase [Virgibacillus sp.]|nr:nitroreductase [Virgibacillus sp.]
MINIDVLRAIKERRSVHTFKKEEVADEIIHEIFTYGSWAPTHYMKEPWKIKLFQEKGKTGFIQAIIRSYQRIGFIKKDQKPKTLKMIDSMTDFLSVIPHHALIYFDKEADPVRQEEEYAAVSAFIQNIQLAGWAYGVGMLWTITPYMHDPAFAREIGLNSEEIKIAAVMQIGYPKTIAKTKGRTPIEDKLEIIRT